MSTEVMMDCNSKDLLANKLVMPGYNQGMMEDNLAMLAHMMVLQVCNLDSLASMTTYFVTLPMDCIQCCQILM